MRKNIKNLFWLFIVLIGLSITVVSCNDDDDDRPNPDLLPVASFSATATTVEAGSTVTFMDNSTKEPFLWKWNFEGGNPTYSNEQNPTVLYEGAGTYSVTMKARNEYGADEIIMENFIEVTAPPVVDLEQKAVVRFNFENSLESDLEQGTLEITATTAGAAQYDVRPGGGGAYVFSETNPLVLPGYTGVNGPDPRTVSVWVKTSSESRVTITHWGAQATGSRASFVVNSGGPLRFEVAGGGITGVNSVNDGEWHHVAYTWDGAILRMYIDGVEDTTWETGIINTGAGGETEVEIGTQLGARPFIGAMDDYRIFDIALSQAQIDTLSNIK